MLNEEKKIFKRLSNKCGQIIKKHAMLKPNDKVIIGLSGGKDSLVLCELLADRKKRLPFHIDLHAIHIKARGIGYHVDEDYLHQFCRSLNIPLSIRDINVDLLKNPDKAPCFICSWSRRKAIFAFAKEFQFNKLAFGHHLDDAIQTLLMNMMCHASVSSLPPRLKMFGGRLEIIRPILEMYENQVTELLPFRKYPSQLKSCPYEGNTQRETIKQLIGQMSDTHKNVKMNIFRSTNKIFHEYLPGASYQ